MATPELLKRDYDTAAGPALAALKDLNAFLAGTLSKKTSDWRLGKEKYASKFAFVLATDKTPEQLLAEAEKDLQATRMEMAALAAPRTVKQALRRDRDAPRDARHLHGRRAQDARAGDDVRARERPRDVAAAIEPAGDRHA
jgi:hypothetical protein